MRIGMPVFSSGPTSAPDPPTYRRRTSSYSWVRVGTTQETTIASTSRSVLSRSRSSPPSTTASSSAVAVREVWKRQCSSSSSPRKSPMWVWVLPTSTASSMAAILRCQAQPLRALHGLGPIADLELAVDAAGVLLDGVWRQVELIGDLAVGGAGDQQSEHVALARRERRTRLLLGGREDGSPVADRAHGGGDLVGAPVLRNEARRTGRLRRLGRDPAGAGDQQHAR